MIHDTIEVLQVFGRLVTGKKTGMIMLAALFQKFMAGEISIGDLNTKVSA
jgi:hypothetical protein